MNLTINPTGTWYHGSNMEFTTLKEGSTITQWKELAEAFSHKPTQLGYEDNGEITIKQLNSKQKNNKIR